MNTVGKNTHKSHDEKRPVCRHETHNNKSITTLVHKTNFSIFLSKRKKKGIVSYDAYLLSRLGRSALPQHGEEFT